jgi:hypothetical protein
LAQVIDLHAKQLLTHGREHAGNSHVGQLVIWQIKRKTHALSLNLLMNSKGVSLCLCFRVARSISFFSALPLK